MTSRKGFHKGKDKRLFVNCCRAAGTQSEDRPSGLVAGHWPHRQYGRSTRRGSEGMRGMPGGKKRRGRGKEALRARPAAQRSASMETSVSL